MTIIQTSDFTPCCPLSPAIWSSSESYNSPGDWARELFEPSKDAANLVDSIKNKFGRFWTLSFFVGDVTKRVVLVFLAQFIGPRAPMK